jgi:hypothetical protein
MSDDDDYDDDYDGDWFWLEDGDFGIAVSCNCVSNHESEDKILRTPVKLLN